MNTTTTTPATAMALALQNAMAIAPVVDAVENNAVFKYTPAVLSDSFDQLRVDPMKYKFISTKEIVEALAEHGFHAIRATQANTRLAYRRAFVKHLLAFDMPEIEGFVAPEGMRAQIMLLNSHDGTTSYQLFLGLYNDLTQTNVIVGANTFDVQRVMHKGKKSIDEIILKSKTCIDGFTEVLKTIDIAKQTPMTAEQQLEFAELAVFARFGEMKMAGTELLKPLSDEDVGNDVWSVFSRIRTWIINPNSVQGYRPVSFTNRKITSIRNIAKNVKLNRAVWDLMYSYLPQ